MEGLSLTEVFSALNSRVFDFESLSYNNLLFESEGKIKYIDFDHKAIIRDLYLKVGALDDLLVHKETDSYKKRVLKILDGGITHIIAETKKKKGKNTDPKDLKELDNCFRTELFAYLFHLQTIQTSKSKAFEQAFKKKNPVKANESQTIKPTIEAPDITLAQANPTFKPRLSNQQSAYLLFYFQQRGITPAYTTESIKKLAKTIFSRNGKNVSTKYSYIGELKEHKDLAMLKSELEEVIKLIDTDLRTAKK